MELLIQTITHMNAQNLFLLKHLKWLLFFFFKCSVSRDRELFYAEPWGPCRQNVHEVYVCVRMYMMTPYFCAKLALFYQSNVFETSTQHGSQLAVFVPQVTI